jgi:hypothetical protein
MLCHFTNTLYYTVEYIPLRVNLQEDGTSIELFLFCLNFSTTFLKTTNIRNFLYPVNFPTSPTVTVQKKLENLSTN